MKLKHLLTKAFLLLVLFSISIYTFPQSDQDLWKEIIVIDTIKDYSYSTRYDESNNYPVYKLFDNSLRTCWVASNDPDEKPLLYLKIPDNSRILNIFSGYGKSPSLYHQNSRPGQIVLTFYYGVTPDGWASEWSSISRIKKLPLTLHVDIPDTFCVKSINIEQFNEIKDSLKHIYKDEYNKKFKETGLSEFFVKLEFINTIQGKVYSDLCISEIFFDEKIISPQTNCSENIQDVYIQNDQTLVVLGKDQRLAEFFIQGKILQISEISKNKKWLVLFVMDSDSMGRSEVSHHLYNCCCNCLFDEEILQMTGRKPELYNMFLITSENDDETFLVLENANFGTKNIQLE